LAVDVDLASGSSEGKKKEKERADAVLVQEVLAHSAPTAKVRKGRKRGDWEEGGKKRRRRGEECSSACRCLALKRTQRGERKKKIVKGEGMEGGGRGALGVDHPSFLAPEGVKGGKGKLPAGGEGKGEEGGGVVEQADPLLPSSFPPVVRPLEGKKKKKKAQKKKEGGKERGGGDGDFSFFLSLATSTRQRSKENIGGGKKGREPRPAPSRRKGFEGRKKGGRRHLSFPICAKGGGVGPICHLSIAMSVRQLGGEKERN